MAKNRLEIYYFSRNGEYGKNTKKRSELRPVTGHFHTIDASLVSIELGYLSPQLQRKYCKENKTTLCFRAIFGSVVNGEATVFETRAALSKFFCGIKKQTHRGVSVYLTKKKDTL